MGGRGGGGGGGGGRDASFVGNHSLRPAPANESNWPLRTPMDVATPGSYSGSRGRGADGESGMRNVPAYARRKPREMEYKPYSLADYKRIAPPGKLGSLGPDLASPELQKRQERRKRMQSYAAKLKDMHKSHIPAPIVPKGTISSRESVSKAQRAKEYAQTIRKPGRGGREAPQRTTHTHGLGYAGTRGFGGTFGHGVGGGRAGGGYDLSSGTSKYGGPRGRKARPQDDFRNGGGGASHHHPSPGEYGNTPIEAMELKHRIDLQQVASIRETFN